MKNKTIIKSTPFGYKTCKEFFENIVTPNFNKLKTVESIDDPFREYYDFIFSAGALRDWIINEFQFDLDKIKENFWDNKYFTILHSIYNNSKHYTLEKGKRNFDIKIEGHSLMPTDENGNCIWDDDTIWDDSASWFDTINGESGGTNYVCVISERGTKNEEPIFLYEICKQAYEQYTKLLKRLYKDS